mgnify:CR=1 FL=1
MCAIPVFHHFGIMGAIVSNMSAGLRIVVMETWDTLTFLSLAEEYKVRFLLDYFCPNECTCLLIKARTALSCVVLNYDKVKNIIVNVISMIVVCICS